MTRLEVRKSSYDLMLVTVSQHHASADTETGGIALGHDLGSLIRITELGTPGPNALHRWNEFTRDLEHAQNLAVEAWLNERSEWIGEWHTHPSGDLTPSNLDLRTYLSLLGDPSLRWDRLVSLIVDPNPPVRIAAWLVTPTDAHSIHLTTFVDPTETHR